MQWKTGLLEYSSSRFQRHLQAFELIVSCFPVLPVCCEEDRKIQVRRACFMSLCHYLMAYLLIRLPVFTSNILIPKRQTSLGGGRGMEIPATTSKANILRRNLCSHVGIQFVILSFSIRETFIERQCQQLPRCSGTEAPGRRNLIGLEIYCDLNASQFKVLFSGRRAFDYSLQGAGISHTYLFTPVFEYQFS